LFDRFFPNRQHRNQYAEYINYHHRNFDVKGLTTQGVYTLELAQVFVELALDRQEAEAASADPIRPMAVALQEGRHAVWSYLTSKQIAGRTLVFLGPPGSGKTTLLKHLAITLAPHKTDVNITQGYSRLPILLFLRDYTEQILQNPKFTILHALQEVLRKWQVDIPMDWFQDQLKRGQCLVMLDGLDEVADFRSRQQVVSWVDRQITTFSKNQFIVTSRPFGYRSNPLRKTLELEVQPFSINQVEHFVHRWYLANEIMAAQRDDPGVQMEARSGAEDLLMRLRRAHVLLDMAVNPLLLTMIATVHRYRSSLPGRRVELYAEICEVFLGKRQQARGMTFDLTPAQKQRVLQPLAFHMMRQQQREILLPEAVNVIQGHLNRVSPQSSGEQFLEDVVNSSGLLVEREAELFGFAHLTFQEYLAAMHVQDQRLENDLIKRVEDTWWHETIRLYAAQVDATNIVRACLNKRTPSIQALTLAMECLEEAREVHADLRNIFDRLAQSVDHQNPEVRRISAEVKLALRVRRMMRVDEDRYIDHSFISHAEYQLFLDESRRFNQYFHPDHWEGYAFASGHGQRPIVGVRPADAVAFCDWLTKRDQGEWRYRLPRKNEIESMTNNNNVDDSQEKSVSYWVTVSGHAFTNSHFDPSGVASFEGMQRRVHEWFTNDWRMHSRLTNFQQASQLIVARVQQRRFAMRDLDRNLQLSRLEAPDIVHDVNVVRNRGTVSRSQALQARIRYDLTLAQDLDIERARLITLDEVVQVARVISNELDHAQNLENAPDLARQLVRRLERAHSHAQNKESIFQPELIRALTEAQSSANDLVLTLQDAQKLARRRVRTNSILYISELLHQIESLQVENAAADMDEAKRLLDSYVDLYLDFLLLEARINRQLPSFEGIRIIKERKQPLM
jgi:energy-coupling factor transporter ATP-binding protein EcfA2